MNLNDTNIIFLHHDAGSGGDTIATILEDNELFETTYTFTLNKNGRTVTQYKSYYNDILFNKIGNGQIIKTPVDFYWHDKKDLDILKNAIDDTNSKGKILVFKVNSWDSLKNLKNEFTNSKIVAIDYPKSIFNCILKNNYKITENKEAIIDKNQEKLMAKDLIKSHAYFLLNMLKHKELNYSNPIQNEKIVDIKINFENILLNNFLSYLGNLFQYNFNNKSINYHANWLKKQFKMYRYKITDNKKFNECFGHNKLATINEKNIDLDYIDQTFLIHYTKTNNLNLPKNTIKNVKDAIEFFENLE